MLLIFFAISTSLVINQKGIRLQLPSAVSVSTEKKGVMLSITKDSKIYIEKSEVDIPMLQTIVEGLMKQNPETQFIINADRETPYATVMAALDNIRVGGCYDIVLEAKKKPKEQ